MIRMELTKAGTLTTLMRCELINEEVCVRSPHCKHALNACLKKGDLSRITSIHGRARVTALDGLTVHDALTMSYFVGGKYKRYSNQDLNYDVNNGSMLVLDAATPVVNDTKVIFDTTPLSPVKHRCRFLIVLLSRSGASDSYTRQQRPPH